MTKRLVVKAIHPLPPVIPPPKKKHRSHDELLAAQGYRYYSFVWPIGLIQKLMETEAPGQKANDCVRELIEREIAQRASHA